MSKHAKLSPSAAHRWMSCTAAPTLEARYEDQSSVYAAEGTEAHRLAELCARRATGLMTEAKYKKAVKDFEAGAEFYNQEMLEAAEDYGAYIKEVYLKVLDTCPDPVVAFEERLDLTEWIPEGFGTADCIIIAEPDMYVIDFKYGKGVAVEAQGNPQMEIYALGAWSEYGFFYDIKTVNMTIVQPRLGGISETSIEREALVAWGNVGIKPKAKEAYEGPGTFRPSEEACKFCKARGDCKARADYYVNLFDDNEPLGDVMTLEQIGELLELSKGMSAWLKDLEERAYTLLMEGTPVPGWKLVAGRSTRTWADEEAVAKVLKTKGKLKASEIYTKKLNGITAIEKLLGKNKFAEILPLGELVIKPEGKPTLAPADDKRPEIKPADEVVKAFDE